MHVVTKNNKGRNACATLLLMPMVLLAAPQLRLSTAALGPVNIAIGSDGPAQTVTIQNVGDGTLNLSASSSAAWLAPALSSDHLQVALHTASLAKGIYTGSILLSDPNAIDTPQDVTVTVQIGGGVPDKLDLVVPPGGSAQNRFVSSCSVSRSVMQPSSGLTLSLGLEGNGSFSFNCTYNVSAAAAASVGDGNYNGSFTLAQASFAADNKTVPVAIHVTSQPIAQATPDSLQFRIAQGAPSRIGYIQISNAGLGNLAITDVHAQSSGGSWLQAQASGQLIQVTADAGGLSPGAYSGQVVITTNGFIPTTTVMVKLDVLAPSPPLVTFGGIVDNAIFNAGDPIAAGGMAALFGEQLTTGSPQQAASLPLDSTLAGATLFVNDQPAPLYYVSDNQITFQMPFEAAAGQALVRVDRDGQRGNTVSVQVANRSPRILVLPFGNYAIAVNAADQSLVIPATPGLNAHPAKAGDTITIYAIGLGATDPAVASGAAAPTIEPLARVTVTPQVFFRRGIFTNFSEADPLFAGLTPGFVGLYQINVTIPQDAPTGSSVPIYILFPEAESNHVNIALQ